jgi:hypothetical protein
MSANDRQTTIRPTSGRGRGGVNGSSVVQPATAGHGRGRVRREQRDACDIDESQSGASEPTSSISTSAADVRWRLSTVRTAAHRRQMAAALATASEAMAPIIIISVSYGG